MTSVAIIVLNWQQPQLTLDTINSLLKTNTSGFSYHIFLVDNGSADNSAEVFHQKYTHHPQVSFIPLTSNFGFSGGNNYGIMAAQQENFDYILLINNDVIVDPNFIVELLKPFSKNSQLGIVAPKIYFAPGHEFHHERYQKAELGKVVWSAGGHIDWNNVYANNLGLDEVDHGQFDTFRSDLEFVSNCCILVKTEVFRQTGLLSTDYFMYCEDADFCQQVYRRGYQIAYQPTAVIWHINSGSSQAGGGAFHDYFLTRNRLIFAAKYASFRTNFALLRQSIRLIFTGTSWQKRGVIDFYLGIKQKGSWQ